MAMYSPYDTAETVGFPIRKCPDQSLLSSSPNHIAACHVLHRLLVPRHPPNALSSLLLRLTPYLKVTRTKFKALSKQRYFTFELFNDLELHNFLQSFG